MLDITLEDALFRRPDSRFMLRADHTFHGGTHTALIGPPGGGKSTLLDLLHGSLKLDQGRILFGTRDAAALKPARRPILFAAPAPDFPPRWSVQHVLIAALQRRGLDRTDRLAELLDLSTKWKLETLSERRFSTLSDGEQLRVRFAEIEALRPAVVLANRLLSLSSAFDRLGQAEHLFRSLRIIGSTLVSEISHFEELGLCDQVVVIDGGSLVQSGSPRRVFDAPRSRAAARASGRTSLIPIHVTGRTVESAIGTWTVETSPFSGSGIAIVRPDHFRIAAAGEESDLILNVEEASFADGRWEAAGLLVGGSVLHVRLPGSLPLHKGKLLPLRYDPSSFVLLPGELDEAAGK
ncbi:MAG TPA: ATP-binding cassette domain-containing protein [Thermoanaerobaculia bacterium]|nr:ATP-binding cassette domain-containing protein [Thermoanaerobaculia bacterium]